MDPNSLLKHPVPAPDKPKRPARQQKKKAITRQHDATITGDYNIWYHRYLSNPEERKSRRQQTRSASEHCCNPDRDIGYTRADERGDQTAWLCLYFARGTCSRGKDCTFLHRIPTLFDEQRLPMTHDIFGRQRHRTDRDDMSGVGSFTRDNRTLYVSSIGVPDPETGIAWPDIEEAIQRDFRNWGPMEQIRVVNEHGFAFVRYVFRSSAEFAKQAMANQPLKGIRTSLLHVRWAYEDGGAGSRAGVTGVGQGDEERKRALFRMVIKERARQLGRAIAPDGTVVSVSSLTQTVAGDDVNEDQASSSFVGAIEQQNVNSNADSEVEQAQTLGISVEQLRQVNQYQTGGRLGIIVCPTPSMPSSSSSHSAEASERSLDERIAGIDRYNMTKAGDRVKKREEGRNAAAAVVEDANGLDAADDQASSTRATSESFKDFHFAPPQVVVVRSSVPPPPGMKRSRKVISGGDDLALLGNKRRTPQRSAPPPPPGLKKKK